MKGTLQKTEQGWVVRYDQRTWQDPSAEDGELPLHPDYLYVIDHTGYILGERQEVEFEIVRYCKKHNSDPSKNSVCTLDCGYDEISYAKPITGLIDTSQTVNHIGDANKMVCMFEPRTDTTSATICKHCGKEKFLHNHVPDVGKMVEDDVEESEKEFVKLINGKALPTKQLTEVAEHYFIVGYQEGKDKAKETLYTEEQVREAINMATTSKYDYKLEFYNSDEIIQSLKQSKQ